MVVLAQRSLLSSSPAASLLPTPIPRPSVSSHSTPGPQNWLVRKCNQPIFWCARWMSAPGHRVGDTPRDLGTTLPSIKTRHQCCVYLMEMSGAFLRDLGTLRKPKGLATNKGSLSPLCRSQLASHGDNLSYSIFTKAGLGGIPCCYCLFQSILQAWFPKGKGEE